MKRVIRIVGGACLLALWAHGTLLVAQGELDRAQALEEGKAFGRAGIGSVEGATRVPLSEQGIPAYQGDAPPQIELYPQGLGIEDAARARLPASDPGRFVRDSASLRPRFTLPPDTDPLLRAGRRIQAGADDLIGALGDTYGDCSTETRRYTQAPFMEQSCTEWGVAQRSCERELETRCLRRDACATDGSNAQGLNLSTLQTDTVFSYHYPVLTWGRAERETWRTGDCAIYIRTARFEIEDLESIADFRLQEVSWDDHIQVTLNGQLIFIGPGSGSGFRLINRSCQGRGCGSVRNRIQYHGGGEDRCELGTNWQRRMNLDMRPYLRQGSNLLRMRVAVQGSGEGFLRFAATQYCGCAEFADQWSGSCPALEAQLVQDRCSLLQTECADSADRRVSGELVQRPCWRERRSYQCISDEEFSEESYCAELRRRGCAQIGSTCVQSSEQGGCLEYEQRYRCPQTPESSFTRMNCGAQSYCLDGDCFQSGWQESGDFPQAGAYLSMIEQAAKDVDAGTFEIFQGQDQRCEKRILGFANCCADNGWGLDIGLFQCSAQERLLAEQRRAGRCHYVGSYTGGSLLSRKRTKSFCCFRSKLGRIVQQQGRPQLELDWGGAKAPICRGLQPDELASIDFERLDLSEFYADVLGQASPAKRLDSTELGRRLAERLRALQP